MGKKHKNVNDDAEGRESLLFYRKTPGPSVHET